MGTQKPPFREVNWRFAVQVRRRSLAAACLLTVAAALALGSPPASGAGSRPRLALPPQGLYESCPPNSTSLDCGQRLQTMSRAGFRYVLNYAAWSGSARQVLAFADAAKAAEMKVIWPLNHRAWRDAAANPLGLDLLTTYGSLSSSCLGCLLNSQLLLFAINLVKNHPATWGFYIGDELPPAEASRVDVLAKKTKSIAPAKPHLYVARPGVANLAPFAPLTDVLGADAYPVGSADPGVGSVAGDTRGLARSHGKGSVLVLQAFSWSQYSPQSPYAFPGQKRMRRMRNSAIRSGRPDLVLWYSFHDIFRSATPNENWRALRKAAFSPGPKKVRRKKSPRRRGKPHPPGATQARNR